MTKINRRQMVLLTLLAGAAGSAPAGAQPAKRNSVRIALDWTPNTNHVGLYVARDMGFYTDAGLEVEILPYGDASPGTLIANDIAQFGVTGALGFFTQRSAGADLKAVYAVVQTETGRLVFNDERKDIQRPLDLDGLTYGGFGSNWEKTLIASLIRNDGGKGEFETITLGTSAYEALANGAVDFTLEVYTWEGVKAELEGRKQRAFRYADFGVPDQHTTFLSSSQAFLDAQPEAASAFLKATQRGYAFAVDNPDEAARILVDANKDMLTDPELIRASLKALVEGHYLARADGTVGLIDPAKMESIGAFLHSSGILLDGDGKPLLQKPDFSTYFSNRLLEN